MECKTCGRTCHYCSSCSSDDYLSEGYCDCNCFKKSKFFKDEKGQFFNFLDRLDSGAINSFIGFLQTQHYILDLYYEDWVDEYLKENNAK